MNPQLEGKLIEGAVQQASNTANAGMGLLLAGWNDRRQLKQQGKLQQLQIQGQKEMSDYNLQKQIELWNATGYEAQKAQMKAAGLNPALMYGMGGGGGQSASAQPGNVAGGHAPQGGGEAMGMMNMGLMQAQKAVLESQANLNNVEAEKKKGVDTQESTARIEALLQGVDNARQQHEIQKLEITLKNIENYEKQATQVDRVDYIEYQTKMAMKHLQIVENEAYISSRTIQQKIDIIRQEAIGAVIKNELTQSQIKINEEQINQWIQSNMREWDKMEQENKKIEIQKLMANFQTDPVNKATDQISRLLDNITNIITVTKRR